MDQRQGAVIPFPAEDREPMVSLRLEEYQILSDAFQKFSDASRLLQSKYDELRTESHHLRVELEKKEVEIKRGERLATLGETAAALAHEIRNPLGAISLYTSLLKEDLDDQPEQQELVVGIDRSITTLNHVVSNILHFAKSSKAALVPTSLQALLQELCCQFREIHPKADIRVMMRGNLFISGDDTGLRQLFSNLILNALQAQNLEGYVGIIAVGDAKQIRVRVRDNGAGIPEKTLGKVFEPFMTSKPEGTGLGLAICQEIARSHGADIVAKNRKNGAHFTVQFPRSTKSQRGEKV